MSNYDLFGPSTGPCQNMVHAAFGGLDSAAQAAEPWMKAAARSNLELMSLASRRAQAWMELPARASRCRTPFDVLSEQTRFWQEAFRQHVESSRRVAEAWSPVMRLPAGFGGLFGPDVGARSTERDYITFPEPKSAQSRDERQDGERRAA